VSALREALAGYLQIRRRLGFAMPQDGRLLEGFVEFLEQAGAERITTELALGWARLPVHAHPHRWRQRLGVARGFARHLATIDPASEVPSTDLLPGHRPRIAPYIYTDADIAALLAAAGQLRPPLRAARHATLIGLLAVTGIRPGEALALDRQDVDLRHGVLHVRAGKQDKQREVPLHHSAIRALRGYVRLRDARFPAPSTPAFFIAARGRRMGRGELNQTFTKLIRQAGLEGRGARARPRPHDLRHAFAVRTLLDWHRAGEDIDRRMPLLSAYLGHVDPASTYWYYSDSRVIPTPAPSCA
jgi:integrase/recombinase XerD